MIDTNDVVASIRYELQQHSPEHAALRGLFLSMSQAWDAIESPPADGSLLVLDGGSESLTFVVVHGVAAKDLARERVDLRVGIAGWVVEHREPVISNSPQTDGRFFSKIEEPLHFKTEAILAVLVIVGGRLIGVMEALNQRDSASFSSQDLHVLKTAYRFAAVLLAVFLGRAKDKSEARSGTEC